MSSCTVSPANKNPATVQPAGLTVAQVATRMATYQPQIAELLRRHPTKRAVLLQVLHLVQGEFGWVPRVAIEWSATVAECAPAHAFSVVEFYTMYRQIPYGRFFIQICQTMCCHLQGAEDLIAHLEKKLGIHSGETTPDGLFSLVRVECLALCVKAGWMSLISIRTQRASMRGSTSCARMPRPRRSRLPRPFRLILRLAIWC